MESVFIVSSADWEVEVRAKDFVDAALKGTKQKYDELGELFNISKSVVVVKNKTQHCEVYSPVAIFEDLGMYYIARHLHDVLKML